MPTVGSSKHPKKTAHSGAQPCWKRMRYDAAKLPAGSSFADGLLMGVEVLEGVEVVAEDMGSGKSLSFRHIKVRARCLLERSSQYLFGHAIHLRIPPRPYHLPSW
jgi:hypothetical protein